MKHARFLTPCLGAAVWLFCATSIKAQPILTNTSSLDGQTVTLAFSNQLDPVTASDSTRYAIPGATIQSATLFDMQTVVLSVSGLTGTSYTVTGTGIQDSLGVAGNVSGSGPILGWTSQDIGTVDVPTQVATYGSNYFNILASGYDMWWGADGMSFVYKSVTGDFDKMLRVVYIPTLNGDTRGGLMVREDTTPGSKNVLVGAKQDGTDEILTTWRLTTGGGTGGVSLPRGGASFPTNYWVRLRRVGQFFTAFYQLGGNTNWTVMQTVDFSSAPYATTALLGMGSSAISAEGNPGPGNFIYSDYGDFTRTGASIGITAQPTNVAVAQYTPATFSVSAVITNAQQIDLVYQWYSNGVPVFEGVSPSYTISLPSTNASGSLIHVVVSAPGVAPVTSSNAVLTVVGDSNPPQIVSAAGLPALTVGVHFNKLLDPASATNIANYTVNGNLTIANALLLDDQKTVVLLVPGLSGSSFALTVNGVKDLVGNTAVNLATNGPVLPYSVADVVGTPYITVPSLNYAYASNVLGFHVDGGLVWFQSDSFNYMYQTFTNDFDVRAQCSMVSGGDQASNMALDARDTIDPDSRHIALCIYAMNQNKWVAYGRFSTGGSSGVLGGNWGVNYPSGYNIPNIWIRLKRVGNTISTYAGTNGQTWTQVGNSVTSDFPAAMVVGMNSCTSDLGVPTEKGEYSNFGQIPIVRPQLQISYSAGNVILSWPTNEVTFTLQQSSQLGAGASWATSTNVPVVVGTMEQVTQPVEAGPLFFRLVH